MSSNNKAWEEGSFSGVKYADLDLVRTSPHIKRWRGNLDGSLTITAREDSDTYSRSTTHFTLNSTVQDHANGSFSTGRFAVVSSLKDAGEKNMITGLSQVDTWMIPDSKKEMTLPNATLFAPEGEELPNMEGVKIRRYKGSSDIGENYKSLTSSIEDFFKENKKPVFDVTPHGWRGSSAPTLEERSSLGRLLGSEKLLDAVHSGSVDEAFEDSLSDGKKLIQYLKADDFGVNELPPGQQVSDVERKLNSLLDSVDGNRRDLYQGKVDEVITPLKSQLNQWIDKKFPKEPQELIPPPIPKSSVPMIPNSSMPPGMPPVPGSATPSVLSLEEQVLRGEITPAKLAPGMPPPPQPIENKTTENKSIEKKTEQLESDLLYQTEQKTLKDLEEKANLERKFILKDSEKASNKLVTELSHTFKTGDYVVGESVSGTFIKDLGVAKGANWAEVRDEKGRTHSIKVDELKPDITDSELLGKEIPKSSKEGHIPTTDPTNISNIKGDPEKVHGGGKPPEKVVKTTPSTTTNVNTSAVTTPQSLVTPTQTPITPTPATKTTAQPSKKTSSSAPSSKNNTTVTKKTLPSTPSFTQGQSAFWKGPDYDFPVTFGNSFQGEDGKMYANVTNHMGGKSIVPLDQLFADEKGFDPKNVSQSADPTNVRNIKSKNKTKTSSSKPSSTVSNTTTSSSVKGQIASDKPYYSPETPRANPNDPLGSLHKKSFHNQLKGMGIYVLDVETTGVKSSDKMFSSGRVRIDRKGNQIGNQAVESFYDVGSGGAIDRKHFKTEAEYQEALEKNLARAHSSKKFGNEQKERGSLAGHAKARISGELTTPAQFLSDFEQDIANNQKGSIIWGHNNQFENKQFDTEKLGSDEYSDVHRRMEARNIVNGSGLFGQSRTMSNKNTDPNMKGLTQKATNLLYNDVNKSILSQNPDKLRAALGKYAAANVDIINEVQNQIEAVRLKSGKYTVGDSLHLSRALMSFGAVTDQFDPRNLMFGNKIETLAHVMLGGYQETHQALDDAIVQGKITSRLTEEIDKFRADPNYKSQLVADMNKHITENRGKLANDTFKSSIMRELQEVKHLGDTDGLTKTYDWIRKTTENYSVIEEHAADRAAYAEQFKQALDKAYREKEATADTVKASMEKFIEQNQVEGAASRINGPERAKDGKSIMKKALDGKKKFIAIGGGLAAANLFLGGGEKGEDKKYNTYDELYNSQYYGSGFADWQERNNAHKVLY